MKELALHILDISENSVRAGADLIEISVLAEGEPKMLKISIIDNGKGMNEEELSLVRDSFYTSRTTRRVGLGIPLLSQHAEMASGKVEISSVPGKSTQIDANFLYDHHDRQPLGDLEGCWVLMASSYPEIEWGLSLSSGKGNFEIGTSEIRTTLEIDTISGNELTGQLKRMIRNSIDELGLV